MTVVTPAVPEIIEEELYESVESRTETLHALRELGPPDLVHLIRHPTRNSAKETGLYHHVTGVEASSSASLAAYINTLVFSDVSKKVISGLYCCYNAMSRVDLRVKVKIPGGVEAYAVDERGERLAASEELWLETYLCSVLRAYSYADDGKGDAIKRIMGVRRFNPITSTDAEHRFLEAAERLFFKGPLLGSDSEIQISNLVNNHLTQGLLQYFHTTGRYVSGINLFEKLRTRDPEISSLLARLLVSADEEVKAVALCHDAVEDLPMDYSLLAVQTDFCLSKERADLALECAKRGIVAAPSEFGTWARLAEVYVRLEEWELALITLNSCPMFTYQDRDAPRMSSPAKIVLPVLPECNIDEIDAGESGDEEYVHPSLQRLPAAAYRGTFKKAYSLLTEITSKIGWDKILQHRSQVFFMEGEYDAEQQRQRSSKNSSTQALKAPSVNGVHDDEESSTPPMIAPELKTGEKDSLSMDKEPTTSASAEASRAVIDIEKPVQTISLATPAVDTPDHHLNPTAAPASSLLRNKRTAERWLDALFMALYEDLRNFMMWRSEAAQCRQQSIPYKKTAPEWEILGELAERLHHMDEAMEAWQQGLKIRFSPKAARGLLDVAEEQGDLRSCVGALIRLIAWQYRWYSEFSPSLLRSLRRLIEEEGAVKVRNMVQATSLPPAVLELTNQYAMTCAAFRSTGSDI